jgi:hypothetical protein
MGAPYYYGSGNCSARTAGPPSPLPGEILNLIPDLRPSKFASSSHVIDQPKHKKEAVVVFLHCEKITSSSSVDVPH